MSVLTYHQQVMDQFSKVSADLLGLTPEDDTVVDLRLALADYLRDLRRARGWTQSVAARILGTSQSRVAKMEAADPTVSMDLLIRSLLRLGASRESVGRVIAGM
jgi:DNA-binding transcriptional regulator YiaG